jgi:tetratricopeptide (TPR) repeat protein
MVRELEAQQKEQLAPNPRLLEAVAGALRRDGEEETSLGFLLAAVDAEPLNTRLALRAAAQAHLVGRRAVVVKLLRGAVATLAELEASGSVRPADAAERGAELGIAVVTLAKEESAIALPLLLRGAAQRKLDPAVLTQVPPVVDQMGPDQRDVELLYTLAYAHGRSGEREEAMRLLRRVVAMDPNHVDARKILRVFQR